MTCEIDTVRVPQTRSAAVIRVLIADDHAAVREGVRGVLVAEDGIAVVGEAIDGPSTLRLAGELKPDLIVLDNSMPGLSGLDVSRRLASDHPDVAVVFLTLDPALRDLALAGGAMAYVMKDAPSDELVRAVRATTAAIAARRRVADLPVAHRRILDLLISTRTLSVARLNEILAKRHSDESPAALHATSSESSCGHRDRRRGSNRSRLERRAGSVTVLLPTYERVAAAPDDGRDDRAADRWRAASLSGGTRAEPHLCSDRAAVRLLLLCLCAEVLHHQRRGPGDRGFRRHARRREA